MDKNLETIEGTGLLITQRKIAMIATFKQNIPQDYALTFLRNKKFELSLFNNDGHQQVVSVFDKYGIDLDLPDDNKGEYDWPRKNRKVNGLVVDNKIKEGSYGVHTFTNSEGGKFIEEGIFKDERLEGMGKRDVDDGE